MTRTLRSDTQPAVSKPISYEDPDSSDLSSIASEQSEAEEVGPSKDATKGKKKARTAPSKKRKEEEKVESPSKKRKSEVKGEEGSGKTFSPGFGQEDYTLSMPEPTRDPNTREFNFADHPEFLPNLSPEYASFASPNIRTDPQFRIPYREILRAGSFGGGYFRPIKSPKTGYLYKNDWDDMPKSWYTDLDVSTYLTAAKSDPEVNKWKTKVGQTFQAWEKSGWIMRESFVWGSTALRPRTKSDAGLRE
ncbi:hypothetical protein P7C70_g5543, partial [Phenoliferia sp. Uapishka_3]